MAGPTITLSTRPATAIALVMDLFAELEDDSSGRRHGSRRGDGSRRGVGRCARDPAWARAHFDNQ